MFIIATDNLLSEGGLRAVWSAEVSRTALAYGVSGWRQVEILAEASLRGGSR